MPFARIDLIGLRFGRLCVKALVRVTPSGSLWHCECDCGGSCEATTSRLKRTPNVGCKSCETERRAAVQSKHGESRGNSNGGKTKLYMIWKGMHSRCRDPGNTSWKYYGGKGITVCTEWATYVPFRDWALANGYKEGLSIERENPQLNYVPANCEWITRGENSRRAHLRTRC